MVQAERQVDGATLIQVAGDVLTVGRKFCTGYLQLPRMTAAVLYTTGDAVGGKFIIPVPLSGTIEVAVLLDKDDEGLAMDLAIFTKNFVAAADNDAFTVTDQELEGFLATISFATFSNFATNQVSTVANMGLDYIAPERRLYCQMIARSGPTIAADNFPMVSLTIKSDE